MPGRAQLVIGTAGAGKTTYCRSIASHAQTTKRIMHLVNLDPAADDDDSMNFSIDIRNLISVSDAMEELQLGPNGALVYCMEYLLENLEWLDEELGEYDGDYLVFDCPGQIELYTHLPVMPRIVQLLQQKGYLVCTVYCIDSTSAADAGRFLGGALAALSCMVHLHTPHVNVLTKTDLLPSRGTVRRLLNSDPQDLAAAVNEDTQPRFAALNRAIAGLLDEFNMVGFVAMTATKPRSVSRVLGAVDFALQYGEDEEPRDPRDVAAPDTELGVGPAD